MKLRLSIVFVKNFTLSLNFYFDVTLFPLDACTKFRSPSGFAIATIVHSLRSFRGLH